VAGIAPGFLTDPDKCTIILTRNTPGGTPGFLTAPVATRGAAATTFTITSTNGADTATVNWLLLPKNTGLGASSTSTNNASLRKPPSGLNIQRGVATLVGGTVTVTGVRLRADARVYLLANTIGGTPGHLFASTSNYNVALNSFAINSSSGTDTSTVNWVIITEQPRFSPSGIRVGQSKDVLPGDGDPVSITNMNPFNDQTPAVMASRIDSAGTPGHLFSTTASLTGGNMVIDSTSDTDASTFECALL
jgi:hypothetical protein